MPERVDQSRSRTAAFKLAFLIVSAMLVSAGLLHARQQRLQAAHDLKAALDTATVRERDVRRLRADLAARATPERAHALAGARP